MPLVAKQELQGVFSGREFHPGFRLAPSVVAVLLVGCDGQGHVGGQIGVDQEMMMAGPVFRYASRRDSHAAKPELDEDGAADGFACGR